MTSNFGQVFFISSADNLCYLKNVIMHAPLWNCWFTSWRRSPKRVSRKVIPILVAGHTRHRFYELVDLRISHRETVDPRKRAPFAVSIPRRSFCACSSLYAITGHNMSSCDAVTISQPLRNGSVFDTAKVSHRNSFPQCTATRALLLRRGFGPCHPRLGTAPSPDSMHLENRIVLWNHKRRCIVGGTLSRFLLVGVCQNKFDTRSGTAASAVAIARRPRCCACSRCAQSLRGIYGISS